jgi:hypothetical protein
MKRCGGARNALSSTSTVVTRRKGVSLSDPFRYLEFDAAEILRRFRSSGILDLLEQAEGVTEVEVQEEVVGEEQLDSVESLRIEALKSLVPEPVQSSHVELTLAAEIKSYMKDRELEKEAAWLIPGSLEKYWVSKNALKYLQKAIQMVMMIRAAADESERDFSLSGWLVTARRSCLKPHKIAKMTRILTTSRRKNFKVMRVVRQGRQIGREVPTVDFFTMIGHKIALLK